MNDILRSNYINKIRDYYDSNLIKVLTGVRRCGKSVLLKQIKEDLLALKITDKEHMISINFEDVSFAKINTYLKLNTYIVKHIKGDQKYFIFLDEIQHIKQFEKTLASLKATQNVSVFVTGSNSKLLSGRLATLLVGRCREFKIMPFSYGEYLAFHEQNNLPLPSEPLLDYLRYGGMPQRLDYKNESDIKHYLDSVYSGIVNKDICSPKSKINKESFNLIAKYIIANSAKEFSAESIATYFSKNNNEEVNKRAVYRYLQKMEEACLITRVKRYDIAAKRTLKSIEKQFAIDNGFILSCSSGEIISSSHALENLVFNELLYRGYEVKIGKTYKGEIDFVVMKDKKKCFLQVTYLLSDDATINREFGAFDSVRDPAPRFILSLDKVNMSGRGVTHLYIEDWLKGKKDLILL